MPSRNNSIEGKLPFASPHTHFNGLGAEAAATLAMVVGDLALILDDAGRIVDLTANPREFPEAQQWLGRDWLDTVSIESRAKVMEMLANARKGVTQHWRQVNQVTADGEVPVRFVVIRLGEGAAASPSVATCAMPPRSSSACSRRSNRSSGITCACASLRHAIACCSTSRSNRC
jgi:hypothetical protein